MAACFVVAFVALMLAAAVSDIASMTIPNRIPLAIAALFPLAALAAGMPWVALAWQVAFGAAALAIVFLMFNFNMMGGGDAKLIAACCLFLGASATAPFIVWTTVAGGGLAAIALVARRFAEPSPAGPAFLNRLLSRDRGVPYGVAICTGALAALPASELGARLF